MKDLTTHFIEVEDRMKFESNVYKLHQWYESLGDSEDDYVFIRFNKIDEDGCIYAEYTYNLKFIEEYNFEGIKVGDGIQFISDKLDSDGIPSIRITLDDHIRTYDGYDYIDITGFAEVSEEDSRLLSDFSETYRHLESIKESFFHY